MDVDIKWRIFWIKRHLGESDDFLSVFRLPPIISCIIYVIYGLNIAYERGMVMTVLLQVSVFYIQVLRSDKLPFSLFLYIQSRLRVSSFLFLVL